MIEQAKYLRFLPWVGAACAVVLISSTVNPEMEPIDRINPEMVASAWPGFPTAAPPPLSVPDSSSDSQSFDSGLSSGTGFTSGTSDTSDTSGMSSFGGVSGDSGSDAALPPPPAPSGGSGGSSFDDGAASTGTAVGSSGGGSGSSFFRTTYDTTIGSSAFGVYEKIPGLLQQGVAFSSVRVRKDYYSGQGECESFGAGYWLGYALEEGVLGDQASPDEAPPIVSYKNPMHARATYPPSSRNTEPVPPSTPAGPHWTAECASKEGSGNGTFTHLTGPGGLTVGNAVSESSNVADVGSRAVVSETFTALTDLRIGNVSVGVMSSDFDVETDMDTNEALVSYEIRVGDVTNGADTVLGSGDDGLTLAGTNVPSSNLHEQFNDQVGQQEDAVKQLGTVGLQILEPQVGESGNIITILSGAVSVTNTVTPRQGLIGGDQGLNLIESRFTNTATH